MDDLRHMQLFDDIARELTFNIVDTNALCNGITDKEKLIEIRMRQNDILVELLRKHRRGMLYIQGKPYEPETHIVESVLIGTGGFIP